MSNDVVVAIVGGVFAILVVIVQAVTLKLVDKGNKENIRDHGVVQQKLDGLSSNMQDVKIDILEVKADIKDLDADLDQLKAEFHEHDHRADGTTRKSRKKKAGV